MRTPYQIVAAILLGAIAVGGWFWLERPKTATPAAPATGGQARGGPPAAGAAGRAVGVIVAPIKRGPIAISFDAIGSLRANEAVTITAKTAGLVKIVNFKEGQIAQAGVALIELDDTEAKANLAVAEANRRNAVQLLGRANALLSGQAVAQARVDSLQMEAQAAEAAVRAAQARLQDLTIRAPFTGVAGLRQVSPGSLVRPGDKITTLDDTHVMKLEFTVPERAMGSLVPGLVVQGQTSAYPGRRFDGTVSVIDTRIDPVTRTVAAVALLPNPEGDLRPGMFMTVRLLLDQRPDALLIPEEALVPIADKQFVFVVVNGRAERRSVRIGSRFDGQAEALEGLAEGDLVVTRGLQKIRDGLPVRAEGLPLAPRQQTADEETGQQRTNGVQAPPTTPEKRPERSRDKPE
jgi:membrane fusion protein, multidrug efflux system